MPEACQGMPPELVGSGLESVVVFGLELLEGQGLLARLQLHGPLFPVDVGVQGFEVCLRLEVTTKIPVNQLFQFSAVHFDFPVLGRLKSGGR